MTIINQNEEKCKTDTKVKNDRLCPVTIRLTREAWEAIRDIAADSNRPMSEVVRYAVNQNLNRYLGDIKFMDYEQGEEIRRLICSLMNVTSEVHRELHRIGVNYNQQTMRVNREFKLEVVREMFRNHEISSADYMNKILEIKSEAAQGQNGSLSKDELDDLMTRYEAATSKVGELICRILT